MNTPDLTDLRDYHDEVGRLLDLERGPEPMVLPEPAEPPARFEDHPNERRWQYLKRLQRLAAEGKINADGSWNP